MQQCQKCGYEFTLREIQEKAECPKCKEIEASRINRSALVNGKRKPLFTVIAMAFVLVIGVLGVRFYFEFSARQELIAKIDQRVREFNGLSMELLDQSAGMTKGGFLEKASRRIAEIDSVVAASMAIDDSALPGAASALAEYGKAQRGLIAAVDAYTRADIANALAKSEFNRVLELEKYDPLDFQSSMNKFDVSTKNLEAAGVKLEMAAKKVRIEGLRLNNACSHDFQILNWQPI